MMNRLLMISHS